MTERDSRGRVIPEVGQVWADNDRRNRGRTLKIVSIGKEKVRMEVLTNTDEVQAMIDIPGEIRGYQPKDRRGKQVLVSPHRLHPTSTGYRLIERTSPDETDVPNIAGPA